MGHQFGVQKIEPKNGAASERSGAEACLPFPLLSMANRHETLELPTRVPFGAPKPGLTVPKETSLSFREQTPRPFQRVESQETWMGAVDCRLRQDRCN